MLGCSSSDSCPTESAYLSLKVSVIDESGVPICDAYVTDAMTGQPCVRNGCICLYNAGPPLPPISNPQTVTMVASRRGFTPVVDTQMLSKQETCETGARAMTIALHRAVDSGGCVPRDAAKCSDHRTCYDGAMSPGCTSTDETSGDPGASYVCCQ